MSFEDLIGSNIREVRLERELSQEALANACDFSNTTLSAYENGRKIPNLITIAKIAKQLNVSIERLYYGDENNSFIISAPDEGRKIVNSIYYLWKKGVISYFENYINGLEVQDYHQLKEPRGIFLHLDQYSDPIKRLLLSLNEFQSKRDTYPDQEKYLEFLLSSVATEINNAIEKERRHLESYKQSYRV